MDSYIPQLYDLESQKEEALRKLKKELGEWMAAEYYTPHQAS